MNNWKKNTTYILLVVTILLIALFLLGDPSFNTVTLTPKSPQTASVADFNSNLVAHYTFDDGTGADASGRGNNGTISGDVTSGTGKIGQSLVFPGVVASHVSIPSNDSLNITGAFSVSAWIRPSVTTTGTATIVNKGTANLDASQEHYILTATSNGNLIFRISNGTSLLSTTPYSPPAVTPQGNTWYHVVGTYNGSDTISLYINGVLNGTASAANFGSLKQDTGPLKIGSDASVRPWKGDIDDVRIYSQSLNATQVGELYALGGGNPPENNSPSNPPANPPIDTNTPPPSLNPDTTPPAPPTPPEVVVNSGTYYVDFEGGDDSRAGTSPATAWKHSPGDKNAVGVPNSIKTIPAGTTIKFKGGVLYRGSICLGSDQCGGPNVQVKGTAGNPVTLSGNSWPGSSGTKAIIDGSEPITGWKQCTSAACGNTPQYNNLYYAYIRKPVHLTSLASTMNIHQDDRPLTVSEYPDAQNPYYQVLSGFAQVPPQAVTSTSLTDSRFASFGSELVGKYLYLWVAGNEIASTKILSFNSSTNTITFSPMSPYTDRTMLYAVANLLNPGVLSKPGEYYLDETAQPDGTYKLIVWPLNNANLASGGNVTYSVRSGGVSIWYPEYVTVEGFKVQKQSGEAYCDGSAIVGVGSSVSPGMIIRDNEITMGRSSNCSWIMTLNNRDVRIENNNIHDNGGSSRGIQFGGVGVVVKNNTIRNSGRTPIYCSGCSNTAIIGNTVEDNLGDHSNGISVYQGSSNVLVAGNVVINSNAAMTFENGTNFTIINNLLLGSGVSCWGSCNGGLIANNIIEGKGTLLASGYFKNGVIKNNIGLNANLGSDISNIMPDYGTPLDRSTLFVSSPRMRAEIIDNQKLPSLNNVSKIYLDSTYSTVAKVGDVLRFSFDASSRTVTAVSNGIFAGNFRTAVTFTPAISTISDGMVSIWPAGTSNFSEDYHLKSGSIAVDAGADISSYLSSVRSNFPWYNFALDNAGTPRPQGSKWDIGPYEYYSGQPVTPISIVPTIISSPTPLPPTTPIVPATSTTPNSLPVIPAYIPIDQRPVAPDVPEIPRATTPNTPAPATQPSFISRFIPSLSGSKTVSPYNVTSRKTAGEFVPLPEDMPEDTFSAPATMSFSETIKDILSYITRRIVNGFQRVIGR